jgi:hypothetical protein
MAFPRISFRPIVALPISFGSAATTSCANVLALVSIRRSFKDI